MLKSYFLSVGLNKTYPAKETRLQTRQGRRELPRTRPASHPLLSGCSGGAEVSAGLAGQPEQPLLVTLPRRRGQLQRRQVQAGIGRSFPPWEGTWT